MAGILGLRNDESVKRKARRGELPARIPGIRKYLWEKKVIDDWIRSGHLPDLDRATLLAMRLGYPIPEATGYGFDPDNLRKLVKDR